MNLYRLKIFQVYIQTFEMYNISFKQVEIENDTRQLPGIRIRRW